MNQKRNKKDKQAEDFDLAHGLHKQLKGIGVTENAIFPQNRNKETYEPRTLIDQTLELIDPTPNIHTLFVQFNARFFWNVLLPVEVKWSTRMTACAGICTFHPRNRQCIIALSAPLLKLRPRKDLVETLLHEMIHGFLFLQNNNRDRDGHGPEFCKHMNRINKEAGTNITVYHDFHAEVKLYQQHWWKCNGPCQHRPPYFGTVRRSMNRAPGPSDYWWNDHQRSCGGQFIKVKEPENYKNKKSSNQKESVPTKTKSNGNMLQWLIQNDTSKTSPTVKSPTSTIINGILTRNPRQPCNSNDCNANKENKRNGNEIKKLGNTTNNLYGWGTGGPKSCSKPDVSPSSCRTNSNSSGSATTSNGKFSSSGVVGGSGRGYSKLLDQFSTPKNNNRNNRVTFGTVIENDRLPTPTTPKKSILKRRNSDIDNITNSELPNEQIKCLVCDLYIFAKNANDHVNACLDSVTSGDHRSRKHEAVSNCDSSLGAPLHKKQRSEKEQSQTKEEGLAAPTDSEIVNCPVCSKRIRAVDINDHLDNLCLPQRDDNLEYNRTMLNQFVVNDNDVIVIDDTITETSSNDMTFQNDNVTNATVHPLIIKDTHKCLVCDRVLQVGTSLNEHLEECVGSIFNDETIATEDNNDTEIEQSALNSDEYLCPVCLEKILKDHINEHLDMCLKQD